MYIVILFMLNVYDRNHHKLFFFSFFLPVLVCVCEINTILSHSQIHKLFFRIFKSQQNSSLSVCWFNHWWHVSLWLVVMLVMNTNCSKHFSHPKIDQISPEGCRFLFQSHLESFHYLIVTVSEEFPNAQPAFVVFLKGSFKMYNRRETASVFWLRFLCCHAGFTIFRVQVSKLQKYILYCSGHHRCQVNGGNLCWGFVFLNNQSGSEQSFNPENNGRRCSGSTYSGQTLPSCCVQDIPNQQQQLSTKPVRPNRCIQQCSSNSTCW